MLRAVLDSANQEYSSACGEVLPGWAEISAWGPGAHPSLSTPTDPSAEARNAGWTIMPPSRWFEQPLGLRKQVGTKLLDQAASKLLKSDWSGNLRVSLSPNDPASLWDSPFALRFQRVCFLRLRCSIKAHYYQLRIEEAVNEEWFLWSIIKTPKATL